MAGLKQGEFVGALDCGTTSVRFIVFDSFANIIAEHQLEFTQHYPHPGWHGHNAVEIIQVAEECIAGAVSKLEGKGWSGKSIKTIGITNQRETTIAWHRISGKPLCQAIVWTDTRNKGEVSGYERKLHEVGFEVEDGSFVRGDDAVETLKTLWVYWQLNISWNFPLTAGINTIERTGLKLSTYFSALKLHWMIQHYPEVKEAHDSDNLLFGTVDSWVVYVSQFDFSPL
jgi:glycerol kinase